MERHMQNNVASASPQRDRQLRTIEFPARNQVLHFEERREPSSRHSSSNSSNRTAKLSFSKDPEEDQDLIIEEVSESNGEYQTSSLPRSETEESKKHSIPSHRSKQGIRMQSPQLILQANSIQSIGDLLRTGLDEFSEGQLNS